MGSRGSRHAEDIPHFVLRVQFCQQFCPDNLALATATYSLHQSVSPKLHLRDLTEDQFTRHYGSFANRWCLWRLKAMIFFRTWSWRHLAQDGCAQRRFPSVVKHEKSRPPEAVKQVYAEHYDADSESPVQYASTGDASTVPAASHAARMPDDLPAIGCF